VTVERYVDARELALIMGVSVRTIGRMTAAGMPSETWGMGRTRRYLATEAIAWAHTRANIDAVNPLDGRANGQRAQPRRK
jgi:phage terminase Nu1 subunit (DNA packaging protein)